jgi:hypothetical protein
MATMQHEIFSVRESATAVQRAFRIRLNIQPPTRKNIYRWNHQFEQIVSKSRITTAVNSVTNEFGYTRAAEGGHIEHL